jgi:hypothetical protein
MKNMKFPMRLALVLAFTFSVGVLAGGHLFSRTIPRSFLTVPNCEGNCASPRQLAGLLASVGIQRTPALIPSVEQESTECIAVRHPNPEARLHLVLFPKRDVRNILEVTPEDQPYVFGCFALARELAARSGIQNYRLLTNGTALQHLTYLHFHLTAK